MLTQEKLDKILAIQIAVARLGEKPIRFWWNSDIVGVDGGTDLLHRLVGNAMAPLSAVEGVLFVAEQAEGRRLSAIPGPQAYSLFCPEPVLRRTLRHRFRHFKTYPDELPEALAILVTDELQEDDLIAAIGSGAGGAVAESETSFGVELQIDGSAQDPGELASLLGSIATRSARGSYTLPYYRDAVGA